MVWGKYSLSRYPDPLGYRLCWRYPDRKGVRFRIPFIGVRPSHPGHHLAQRSPILVFVGFKDLKGQDFGTPRHLILEVLWMLKV